MTVKMKKRLREQILKVAARNVGYGEVGKNNAGQFVRAIGGKQGQSWCAAFVGWVYETAWHECDLPFPITRSLGAKAMGRNIAKHGRRFDSVDQLKPGDVFILHRGLIPWQGHIGIVHGVGYGNVIDTIEGNVGAFPAKVRYLTRDISNERLAFFASPFSE